MCALYSVHYTQYEHMYKYMSYELIDIFSIYNLLLYCDVYVNNTCKQ